MDITAINSLWDFKVITSYNDKTQLVMNRHTKSLMIKKCVAKDEFHIHRLLQTINHKNIIKIYDCIVNEKDCIVLEEFVHGKTVEQLQKENAIDETLALNITLQLCEGLSELHKINIVHRDITDTNIILSNDGVVKMIDFGISRTPKDNSVRDTRILGTEGFAAPEQFGFHQSTPQTDIYSVGVLLNVMLTGDLPSEQLYAANPKITKIIKKCTELDPKNRFNDALSLRNALRRLYKQNNNQQTSDFTAPAFDNVNTGIVNTIMDGLPGIKSPKLLTRILSTMGYLFVLFFIFCMFHFEGYTPSRIGLSILVTIFMVLIPFFCYSNYLSFQDGILKNISHSNKRILFNLLATVSLFFGMYLFNILI